MITVRMAWGAAHISAISGTLTIKIIRIIGSAAGWKFLFSAIFLSATLWVTVGSVWQKIRAVRVFFESKTCIFVQNHQFWGQKWAEISRFWSHFPFFLGVAWYLTFHERKIKGVDIQYVTHIMMNQSSQLPTLESAKVREEKIYLYIIIYKYK